MRPFFVGVYDAQMLLQEQPLHYETVVSLIGDLPAAFWQNNFRGAAFYAAYFWGSVSAYSKAHAAQAQHDPIERLLCYPEASPSLLQWAWSVGYREQVLRSPACTAELVELLPADVLEDSPYRGEVHARRLDYLTLHKASSPHTNAAALEALLASSKEPEIFAGIAQNPQASTRILSLLWDRDEASHPLIATHQETAPFILQEFYQDKLLCQYLTQNLALSKGMAVSLCEHFLAQLQSAATIELKRESQQALNRLGLNYGLSASTLEQLATLMLKERNEGGAIALLINPQTPFWQKQALRKLGDYTRRVEDSERAPFFLDNSYQKEYRWLCQQPMFPQAW